MCLFPFEDPVIFLWHEIQPGFGEQLRVIKEQ